MEEAPQQRSKPLSRLQLASYALPSIPMAAVGLPLLVHIPPFYASQAGLSLELVGCTSTTTGLGGASIFLSSSVPAAPIVIPAKTTTAAPTNTHDGSVCNPLACALLCAG